MIFLKAPVTRLALALALAGSPALAQESFLVGVLSAQSGYLAPYDQPSYAGFRFCVDEINARGGLAGGVPIVLEVRDTRSDIAETMKGAQELIDLGTGFIVTPADADPTIAVGQVTQAAGIPTMTFAGTAPILTTAGDFVFGSYPADNQQATVLAQFARDEGFARAWLLKSPESSYTMGGPEYFGEVFTALGGEVMGESIYSMNQPDFSAIVTTIAQADPAPDVIVTWAWEPDFPAFIRSLRSAQVDIQVMGADVLDTPTVRGLGPVVAGTYHTSGGFPDEGSAQADFNARFEAATGQEADNNYYANGCDIALMIEQAAAAAGTTEPAALRDALAAIEAGAGVMSTFTFAGTDRMPLRPVVVARINEAGQKVLIRRAVADPALLPAP